MGMETKYVWDIVIEKNLTKQQLKAVNEISKILSSGGKISKIRQNVQTDFLKFYTK